MNDNLQNEKQDLLPQIMAVVGFVVMVCLLAWLAIQLVRLVPTVFSTLAGMFENNQRELRERTGQEDANVVVVDEDTADDFPPEATSTEEVAPEPVPEEPAPTAPVVTTPAPSKPVPTPIQYKTVATYKVPVSDPNGTTDLQAAFIAVGRLSAEGRFVATPDLQQDELSAVRFSVKNIGTKTSGEWSFVAQLPNGSTFTSKVQQPLKPSETATLTLTFTPEKRGTRAFTMTALGGNDINAANNGFRVDIVIR